MNNGALTHCEVNKKEQNIQTQQQICFMVVYVSGGAFIGLAPPDYYNTYRTTPRLPSVRAPRHTRSPHR